MVMLQVMEFAIAMQEEEDAEVHGGLLKAPKVLADIVESVAAAVYVDCNFNLKDMWLVSFSFACFLCNYYILFVLIFGQNGLYYTMYNLVILLGENKFKTCHK